VSIALPAIDQLFRRYPHDTGGVEFFYGRL
jgi:hypothetical protein